MVLWIFDMRVSKRRELTMKGVNTTRSLSKFAGIGKQKFMSYAAGGTSMSTMVVEFFLCLIAITRH
jgi:hypothetical protein